MIDEILADLLALRNLYRDSGQLIKVLAINRAIVIVKRRKAAAS